MTTVLIIEDEPSIAEALIYVLEQDNFTVYWKSLAEEGIALLHSHSVDFIILDIGLPDITGFEACKKIRRFSEVPILFLTARNEEIDKIIGLEIGGDDYVTKPFSPREVLARIKVILKRSQKENTPIITAAKASLFTYNADAQQIFFNNHPISLTKCEMQLFAHMLSQPNRVFNREQLLDAMGADEDSLERSVDTHMKTLRQKISAYTNKNIIKTHRGLGYSVISLA